MFLSSYIGPVFVTVFALLYVAMAAGAAAETGDLSSKGFKLFGLLFPGTVIVIFWMLFLFDKF